MTAHSLAVARAALERTFVARPPAAVERLAQSAVDEALELRVGSSPEDVDAAALAALRVAVPEVPHDLAVLGEAFSWPSLWAWTPRADNVEAVHAIYGAGAKPNLMVIQGLAVLLDLAREVVVYAMAVTPARSNAAG